MSKASRIISLGALLCCLLAVTLYQASYRQDIKTEVIQQKQNVHELMNAVENFATDTGGYYPRTPTELRACTSMVVGTTKISILKNPSTGKPEWPVFGKAINIRAKQLHLMPLNPGALEYIPLVDDKGAALGYLIASGNLKTGEAEVIIRQP